MYRMFMLASAPESSVHWPAKGGGSAPRCHKDGALHRASKASKHCGPRCDVTANHRKTGAELPVASRGKYIIAISSSVGGKIG